MQPTDRDLEVLTQINLWGGQLIDQIDRLIYMNRKVCTRRLLLMEKNLYLSRQKVNPHALGIPYHGTRAVLYSLDQAGAEELARLGYAVDWRPEDKVIAERSLKHHIPNNDIRISLRLALDAAGMEIQRWDTDRSLRRTQPFKVVFTPKTKKKHNPTEGDLIPDDWLTISTPEGTYQLFIEFDTSSMVRSQPEGRPVSISSKIWRYSALLAKKKVPGSQPVEHEPSPFEEQIGEPQGTARVVFITSGTTEKAVEKLATAIKEAGGQQSYLVGRYDLARKEEYIFRPIFRQVGSKQPIYGDLWGRQSTDLIAQWLQQSAIPKRFWPELKQAYLDRLRQVVAPQQKIGLEPAAAIAAANDGEQFIQLFETCLAERQGGGGNERQTV